MFNHMLVCVGLIACHAVPAPNPPVQRPTLAKEPTWFSVESPVPYIERTTGATIAAFRFEQTTRRPGAPRTPMIRIQRNVVGQYMAPFDIVDEPAWRAAADATFQTWMGDGDWVPMIVGRQADAKIEFAGSTIFAIVDAQRVLAFFDGDRLLGRVDPTRLACHCDEPGEPARSVVVALDPPTGILWITTTMEDWVLGRFWTVAHGDPNDGEFELKPVDHVRLKHPPIEPFRPPTHHAGFTVDSPVPYIERATTSMIASYRFKRYDVSWRPASWQPDMIAIEGHFANHRAVRFEILDSPAWRAAADATLRKWMGTGAWVPMIVGERQGDRFTFAGTTIQADADLLGSLSFFDGARSIGLVQTRFGRLVANAPDLIAPGCPLEAYAHDVTVALDPPTGIVFMTEILKQHWPRCGPTRDRPGGQFRTLANRDPNEP